jgi:hypothetical protein
MTIIGSLIHISSIMKSSLLSLKSQLLGAGLLLGAAASSALAGSLGVSYGTSAGNSNLSSTSNYSLTAANSTTSASLTGIASSSVELLGTSKPLETFSFTSGLTKGVSSNNVSLVIGSYIVYSQTTAGNVTWDKSTTQTFVTTNSTVSVPSPTGAIPVAVTGTLSGSGAIVMTAAMTTTNDNVALSGNVGTDVGGTASATVASKYNDKVTLTSDLTIGQATLTANAATDNVKTMSGTFTLSLDSANLLLLVQLNAATSGALVGSDTLASFVLPARAYALLSL